MSPLDELLGGREPRPLRLIPIRFGCPLLALEDGLADNVPSYGDNLGIPRHDLKDQSVDLVCLDPPFNSNASYSVLFVAQDRNARLPRRQAS